MSINRLRSSVGNSRFASKASCVAFLVLLLPALPSLAEVDEDAAKSLARKSNCLKCHSVDKRKNAPSYKEVAAKYSGRADAEQVLIRHLTESPVVESEGVKESHDSPKTTNPAELKNLIGWILSR